MILSITCTVLATLSVTLVCIVLRLREVFRGVSAEISSQKEKSFKAIDSSLGIYFSLLQVGALHGTGGEAMKREMKRLLMTNPEKNGTLLSEICTLADYRYFGIVTHLRSNYPDLTENDLKLCALLCFKPTAAGLMSLYSHNSPACYYNKRWRVMRHMHLPKGEYTLEGFLSEMVNHLESSERQGKFAEIIKIV